MSRLRQFTFFSTTCPEETGSVIISRALPCVACVRRPKSRGTYIVSKVHEAIGEDKEQTEDNLTGTIQRVAFDTRASRNDARKLRLQQRDEEA